VSAAFVLASLFPLVSLLMVATTVREPRARADREAMRETLAAIRVALRDPTVWIVAGFLFFWTFSPSFGPALLYYQTDVLGLSQQFIGHLAALSSLASVAGAFVYAPLSRRVPLRRLINVAIGIGVVSTLAYLAYKGPWSALAIDTVFGGVGMITQLAFLDLAAKACPKRVEATFFALLMSVFNGGTQGSQVLGGYLYDAIGYTPLIFVSAGVSALAWFLVPLVRIEAIEARARADA